MELIHLRRDEVQAVGILEETKRGREQPGVGLHKKSANRIIALKLVQLVADLQFFPQGFPRLCAKLNAAETLFQAQGQESCRGEGQNSSGTI